MVEGTFIPVPKFKEECLLSKGMEVSDLVKVRKEAVMYVQPCASERGKLMGDIELGKEGECSIDPATLCFLLELHRRRFAELKCSPSLGVAKLTWKGKEVSVFKNCKLKVQRALDQAEILRVAGSISRMVWGAAVCGVCGRPAIECASGECGKCTHGERSVRIDELPNGDLLKKGYVALGKARELPEESESFIKEAQYLGLFFTTEAVHKGDAVLGLVLLGEVKKVVK